MSGDHPDLQVLPNSFPRRRSSDLEPAAGHLLKVSDPDELNFSAVAAFGVGPGLNRTDWLVFGQIELGGCGPEKLPVLVGKVEPGPGKLVELGSGGTTQPHPEKNCDRCCGKGLHHRNPPCLRSSTG